MRKKIVKVFILASIIVASYFLISPIILGVSPLDSILAQEIFFDMMRGQLTGFLKLTVKSTINGKAFDGELCFIAIHNFTSSEHKWNLSDRIIYDRYANPISTYVLKVERIPERVAHGKVRYRFQEFYIHIATSQYVGATYLVVEPDLPIKTLEVEVPLNVKRETGGEPIETHSCPTDQHEISTNQEHSWVKCGECHSIQGIRAEWGVERDTIIYFTQYSRDKTYDWYDWGGPCYACTGTTDTGWYESGKVPVESSTDDVVTQDGAGAKKVLALVYYKCERWYESNFIGVDGEHTDYEYFIMTPIDMNNIEPGDAVTCSQCGGTATSYATPESSTDVTKEFEMGDEGYWEWTSVSFSFSFSSGRQISFGFSISAVRKSIEGPYVRLVVTSWGNPQHKYWYWYDNNDRHSHILHLSWIPPP